MLELRTVGVEDWPLWRAVRLAALAEAPAAFGSTLAEWQGAGDRPERWRDRLSIPGARDLIAFLDGQPVAMVSGVPGRTPGTVEVISMWVSPAVRGQGVGNRLLETIASWSADQGATAVVLSVRAANAVAIRAYRRAGFTLDVGPDGHAVPNAEGELQMTLTLDGR